MSGDQGSKALLTDTLACVAPALNSETVQDVFNFRSDKIALHNTVHHAAKLPSNLPCEDFYIGASYDALRDPTKDWNVWAIFDGHAGPQTASFLALALPYYLLHYLEHDNCFTRPYMPNDEHINSAIRKCFLGLDEQILSQASHNVERSMPLAEKIHLAARASAGSCALVALYE